MSFFGMAADITQLQTALFIATFSRRGQNIHHLLKCSELSKVNVVALCCVGGKSDFQTVLHYSFIFI